VSNAVRADPAGLPGVESDAQLSRRYGRIAAALLIAGSLVSIPNTLLYGEMHSWSVYLITGLGAASGLVCLALPWERIPLRWFHLLAVLATAEVALAVGVAGDQYLWYYLFVAVFAAYVFPSRREVAIQVAIAGLAFMAPVVYDPDVAHGTISTGLIAIPSLALTAAVVVYLRERLEANEDSYRTLAVGVIDVVLRLRQSRIAEIAEADDLETLLAVREQLRPTAEAKSRRLTRH
jgi:hypothetical protein